MSEPNDNAGSGSGGRLRQALSRRIVWLTDRRRDASGDTTESRALVAVLGREHYSERRRQYPILSRRDLDSVLKQELAGGLPTLTVVSAARDDRREVTFYEFKPEVLSQVAPAFMLVPESLALAATLPAGRVATVERAGFRYFLASGGVSQPEGGAVTSADLFAMAAGLDSGDAVTISGERLHDRIVSGLGRLKPETWLQLRMPSLGQRLEIDWQPIATMAGVGLVAYLALASGYLAVTREAREKELAGLGGEVEKLLVAQRDVDRMLSEQAGLAAVMADRRNTYRLWQVVSVAWSKGAQIKSVELRDATLTIRGDAAVATDVLAAIDAIPGFADAKFSAPVRSGRSGRENFSLVVTMQPESKRG
jgi:hypothetical protein